MFKKATLVASVLAAFSTMSLACTTVLVGPEATAGRFFFCWP